ncbi:unnamed protein product [Cladocopium goreaui]|uniref:Uncharacterized protein n=1 Tax=Cladocopium goreaui TaxID=2562237 RepID=A0A9P1FM86_9DINO|nr:unnamed protein product [Cladocopium goreaui]
MAPPNSLRDLLHLVQPPYRKKDLEAIEARLCRVGITSVAELQVAVRGKTLGEMLQRSGKPLPAHTLDTLASVVEGVADGSVGAPPRDRSKEEFPRMHGLSHIRRSPRWSFKQSSDFERRFLPPGPGTYHLDDGSEAVNAVSRYQKAGEGRREGPDFGGSWYFLMVLKMRFLSEFPSFGAQNCCVAGPIFSFGLSGRDPIGKQKIPGPGAYELAQEAGLSASKWTMTPRRECHGRGAAGALAAGAGEPGPGKYDLEETFGKSAKYTAGQKFAGSPGGDMGKTRVLPGPGDYSQADFWDPKNGTLHFCTLGIMAEHMQLATEEAQEMLLEEIPESPSTKPRHWYLAGAGLALLVVLGVAAKVVYRSPETLLQSKNFDINTVQEWEQIPGIDQVVEHAKTLELKQPLRNLNDLFYESQPEELPWIRTECVIDVVQGAAYLGQAVVFLYKAGGFLIHLSWVPAHGRVAAGWSPPDGLPEAVARGLNHIVDVAANRTLALLVVSPLLPKHYGIAGFITSVTWIASYLSFAANACGAAVNSGALCAGDWTALMANFGEMATVGAAVKEDCDFNKDWLALLKITGTDDAGPGWKTFVPAGALPTVETVQKVDALRTADRNRAFDLTQCVVADVTNAAAYIVRAILQIRSAASACPEPKPLGSERQTSTDAVAWQHKAVMIVKSRHEVTA